MTPTLDQILASLGGRRRAKDARTSTQQKLPNEWTTSKGDHAETYRARTIPGRPQRYGWRLVAPNGETVAASGQTFKRRRSARAALHREFPYPGSAS